MQDFPIKVKVAGGLPVEEDSPGLSACINLKPFNKGMKAVLAPRPKFFLTGVPWPFPQYIRLVDTVYVCTPDTIYREDANGLTPLLTGIPNAGYPWSGAEVGGFRIFVNNKVVVTGRETLALDTTQKIPTGIAITSVSSHFIIAAPWIYGKWHKDFVAWSTVSTPDFTIDRSNLAALRYADCGTVLGLLPYRRKTLSGLHHGFIALGSEGVVSWLTAAIPAVFNQVKAFQYGMHSQLAYAGDLHHQFFLATNKTLCEITEGEVKPLGYSHLFHNIDGEIVFSYNGKDQELWIGY